MKKLLNFLKFTVSVAVCFVFGVFVAQAMGYEQYAMTAGAATVVLATLVPQMQVGMLAETIPSVNTPDVSKLVAYAGKFERKLFSTLLNGLDIANDNTVIPGVKNAINLTKLTVGKGIKGYAEDFEPNAGDLDYSGRKLSVELVKRDIQINPLKYRNTWLAEVMKPGVNINDLPFAAFVYNAIMAALAAEVNDDGYLAVVDDFSTFGKSVNGFGSIIASEITATNITPVATGAITNTNAVAKVELVANEMPIPYQKAGFQVKLSYPVWKMYQEDYRERYGKYLQRNVDGDYTLDTFGPKVKIVPATWLGTSQRIIATPKENLLVGVDALGDVDRLLPETEFELIKLRVLFAMGFQIRDLGALRVNDVA